MAKVGAQRAAELTGKSKSTIQRAMNAGKLSYEKDNNDRRVIDVSELERVYGLAGSTTSTSSSNNTSVASKTSVEAEIKRASDMIEMERMKMKIQALETQLETAETTVDDLRSQRDQWQKQAQQVLITSQYSQKQAEEYKSELRTREETARRRRAERERAMIEKQAATRSHKEQVQSRSNSNDKKPAEKKLTEANVKKQELKEILDFQGLWKKIKGDKAA